MSKLILFDFRCTVCDDKFDALVNSCMLSTQCPKCHGHSKRLISAPRIAIKGTDPDFPKAYADWERQLKQKQKQDKKFYKEHGADKKHHSYGS